MSKDLIDYTNRKKKVVITEVDKKFKITVIDRSGNILFRDSNIEEIILNNVSKINMVLTKAKK